MITTKLKFQQAEALAKSLHLKVFALFMDMGTGKTLTAMYWVYYKALHNVLLILRNDDFVTWISQIKQHSNFTCSVISNIEDFEEDSRFKIISYELFKKYSKKIARTNFDCVICDEADKIKHSNTKRYKILYKNTRHIPYKLILTGTPVTNTIDNLFSQIKFLDDGVRLGRTINMFKKKYYFKADTYVWILHADAIKKIKKKIDDISYTIKTEECLVLPEKNHIKVYAEKTALQNKYYNQLVKNWEVNFPDKSILVEYIISKISKLLQISSGFFYDDEDSIYTFKTGKLDVLKSLLDGKFKKKTKIVIWCSFTEEILFLKEQLQNYGKINIFYGGLNKKKRMESRLSFYEDKSIRFFIAQVGCGIGMNELVVSNTVIYFSHDWKLSSFLQSFKRTYRIGSEVHKEITYVSILTKNSFDEVILKALEGNKDILDEIMSNRIEVK